MSTKDSIAWGKRDRLLPPRQGHRARKLLPGARHLSLPGCGHTPFGDDRDFLAFVLLAASAATTQHG